MSGQEIAGYLVMLVVVGIPIIKLLGKVGLSRYWGLLLIIPVLGIWTLLMILAFARWPAQRTADKGSERTSQTLICLALVFSVLAETGPMLQAVAQVEEERCAGVALGPDAAIRACTRDIESGFLVDEDLSIAFSNRGLNWSKIGDLDQTFSDCSAAIKLDPRRSAAYICRGHALLQKKELDQAMADFEQAVLLDPVRAVSFDGRGMVWLHRGDFDQAIADFSEAVRLSPENAEFYGHLGNARIGKQAYGEAIAALEQAISLEPANAGYFFDRGNAWRGLSKMDRALSDYETAARLDPTNAEYATAAEAARQGAAGIVAMPQAIARLTLQLMAAAAFLFPMWRVVSRSGRSRWQFLLFLLPIVNLIFIWVLAFGKWPSIDQPQSPSMIGSEKDFPPARSRRNFLVGVAAAAGLAALGLGAWYFVIKGNPALDLQSETDANLPLPDGIYLVMDEGEGSMPADAAMIPNNEPNSPPLSVARQPVVNAVHFASAEAAQDAFGSVVVSIQLTNAGGDLMLAASSDHIGRRLAIVVNGVAITVATVQSPLSGQIQVSGSLTLEQARAIASRLTR